MAFASANEDNAYSNSSDEEESARTKGYAPVLSEHLARATLTASPSTAKSNNNGTWFKEGSTLYNNDLFHEPPGAAANGEAPRGQTPLSVLRSPSLAARPGTPTSAKASRRAERLAEANELVAPNSITRQPLRPASARLESSPIAGSPNVDRQGSLPHQNGTPTIVGNRPAGVFDPNEDPRAYALSRNMASQAQQQQQQQQQQMAPSGPSYPLLNSIDEVARFLVQPGPKSRPSLCRIERQKEGGKVYPKYYLYLEEGRKFLLSARKRKNKSTSNYVISLDAVDISRDSNNFFAKVRANFVGTEFTLFDDGDKPKSDSKGKKENERHVKGRPREELASVTYQYNVLGTRGPRKMTAVIPALDGSGRSLFRPTSEADSMLERIKSNRGLDELVLMRNKPPRWNEELEAYCLNFNGRVTEASVKNFQLVTDDNHNHVILQFGKVGREQFTMDYQWPINALQAFGLCISSFDNKLGCE